MKNWKKNSWKKYPVKHIPEYPDKKELDMVLDKLGTFPPLVFAGETRHLKDQLADVVDGKAFLLQGGDCAESFAEFHPDNIRDTFKAILQMSLVLTHSASMPVIKLGRIAGQFSKPRSSPVEIKNGKELQELIPGSEFVQGAMAVTDRKDAYNDINEGTNTITIATYGVAAVGINIPRIFNLVLLEPGKSFVRVIQSIGRGVRIAEDKDFVQIWDVTSRCKFSKRHLTQRKKYYKEASYPFTIEKIIY